jgi:adenosylhomocysteine nucleosidase
MNRRTFGVVSTAALLAPGVSCAYSGRVSRMVDVVVLVSANAEWAPTKDYFKVQTLEHGSYGEFFHRDVGRSSAVFMHGGWGKVRAAASAEHAISKFKPRLLINVGTCGGFAGRVKRFDLIAAEKTVVYDIAEAFGDAHEAIRSYTTAIDLSWSKELLSGISIGTLLTGDRDLVPDAVAGLKTRYPEALGADWESGAIAYVAAQHRQRLLVLRCVSDLVSEHTDEFSGDLDGFRQRAAQSMTLLLRRTDDIMRRGVPA